MIVVGVLYLNFCLVVWMVVVVVFVGLWWWCWCWFCFVGDDGIVVVLMVMAAVREVAVISSNYLFLCFVLRSPSQHNIHFTMVLTVMVIVGTLVGL